MSINYGRQGKDDQIKDGSTKFISSKSQQNLLNELKGFVNYALSSLDVGYNFVYIEPIDSEIIPVAGALGVCIDNNWLIDKKMTFGKILVNVSVLSQLDSFERLFVISHECAHIFHNHLIATILVSIPSLSMKVLDVVPTNPSNKVLLSNMKSIMGTINRFNVENNINSIRTQELEADLTALNITRDPIAAKSCVLRLCHNDPNSFSHYFEFESRQLPVMTVGQRIQSWYRQ